MMMKQEKALYCTGFSNLLTTEFPRFFQLFVINWYRLHWMQQDSDSKLMLF